MRNIILMSTLLFSITPVSLSFANVNNDSSCPPLLNVEVRSLNEKKRVNLCNEYKNKVVLIVNTASKCAFTPQYDGLETLYKKYKDSGLVVLGFPSNDFSNQEPGTEKQIKSFCRLTYGVQFPMFSKTRVRQDNADPLYHKLGKAAGEYPTWNFHKYLLDRNGRFVASYPSSTKPSNKKLVNRIESLLNAESH